MMRAAMKRVFFPGEEGDTIVRLEPWRRVVADGFDVARKADVCGVWLQDLLPATEFRDRYRQEKKVPLTYTAILLKASALTLKKYPILNSSISRSTLVTPSSIDIGITVAGREVLAPVVVIRGAETKSLSEIVAELRMQGRQAKQQQQQHLETMNKIGRWLPSIIRRRLIGWALRNPTLRKTYVGTFQIAVLSEFPGFAIPMFLSTTFMMGMTGVAKRPVVIDDHLEIRPTAYLQLLGDHRLIAGTQALESIRALQALLLQPEELGD
jgi:pyruvate/2-oxoglutarate dehydrogenase complex dihydrolipoamide acyltransferase (E2) component